jgi:hypothetical protein
MVMGMGIKPALDISCNQRINSSHYSCFTKNTVIAAVMQQKKHSWL